jgi:hypothetical protein
MDDGSGEVVATFFDRRNTMSTEKRLPIPRGTKMSVQGGS